MIDAQAISRDASVVMASQYSVVLSPEQAQKLESYLQEAPGFAEGERQYASYCFEKSGLAVAFYPKRNKLLVQGSGTDDFVEFTLEPKITGVMSLPDCIVEGEDKPYVEKKRVPKGLDLSPHFGIDESGKGDYFGPLVIAGVFCEGDSAMALAKMGCTDSKVIKSEVKMAELARKITQTPGVAYEVVCIGPARYNELYTKMANLNKLLAWGHARVIASLHEKVPSCPRALSDQFAKEWVLQSALKARNIPVELEQRTKGESDIAVAAASILARARFVRWMSEASKAAGQKIPLGCAPHVLKAAKAFVASHGRDKLPEVAKLHFKLTAQL